MRRDIDRFLAGLLAAICFTIAFTSTAFGQSDDKTPKKAKATKSDPAPDWEKEFDEFLASRPGFASSAAARVCADASLARIHHDWIDDES